MPYAYLELSLSGSLTASEQGSLTTIGEFLNVSALDPLLPTFLIATLCLCVLSVITYYSLVVAWEVFWASRRSPSPLDPSAEVVLTVTGSSESSIFSMRGSFKSFPFGQGMSFLFFFKGFVHWVGGHLLSHSDVDKSDMCTSAASSSVNTPCNCLFLSSEAVAACFATSCSSWSASICPAKWWVKPKPGKERTYAATIHGHHSGVEVVHCQHEHLPSSQYWGASWAFWKVPWKEEGPCCHPPSLSPLNYLCKCWMHKPAGVIVCDRAEYIPSSAHFRLLFPIKLREWG